MKFWSKIILTASVIILSVLSYGFIDPHLSFSSSPLYQHIQSYLVTLVYRQSFIAAGMYMALLTLMFIAYGRLIKEKHATKKNYLPGWLMGIIGILLLAYPALSYDIFNYIATAKVTFQYQENPYVIMPIEIPNEPMLSYTRAANKFALYGPTWIALTSFPHLFGMRNPWLTILSFKAFVMVFYVALIYMIYRKTKRWEAAIWFAANPLVLMEVLLNGHNDIVMMALAVGGILLWQRDRPINKVIGMVLWISSIFVKGATIVLLPLFILPEKYRENTALIGFFLMFGVFLLSPLREEMYPWYAVWWLAFAGFIPLKKQSFIHGFSYWLSFGLMLRYIPWIATREYGGITPVSRVILTSVPIGLYMLSQVQSFRGLLQHWRKRS